MPSDDITQIDGPSPLQDHPTPQVDPFPNLLAPNPDELPPLEPLVRDPADANATLPGFPPEVEEDDDPKEPYDPLVTRADADPVEPSADVAATAQAFRKTTKRVSTQQLRSELLKKLEGGGIRQLGRYSLRIQIGQGGCGTVYKAWDPKHAREVALKALFRSDGQTRRRFERETKAIARLRHPAIVPLLDSGEDRGTLYLVMEFVEGRSLSDLAAAHFMKGEGSLNDIVRHVRDAAEAIQFAHEQGILHRDLKPQNLLIDRHGKTLVVDFGLAHMEDGAELTATGAALGTPAYMPPEQAGAQGGKFDARSDVYSLGATLFHGITGSTPFEGGSAEQLMLAILQHEARAPSDINEDIPPELDAIVLKCLEKEPRRRYATVKDLMDELDRYLRGEPVLARPVGPVGRIVRLAHRRPVVAWLVVALVVLGAAFALLLLKYEQLVRAPG